MLRFITTLCALLVSGLCYAERIENFVLLDQHGTAHNLYYHKDKAAIVIMIQGNGCPIVRNALTDYKALRDNHADDNVHFLMLNSNLQDQRKSILAEAQRFAIDIPILHDETQLVGEALGLVRTAEVLVIDPNTWTIAYRGPINDRQVYERQKSQAADPLRGRCHSQRVGRRASFCAQARHPRLFDQFRPEQCRSQPDQLCRHYCADSVRKMCGLSYRGRSRPMGYVQLCHGARLCSHDA
jgi:hypothetical protein